jgi:PAS domain S-box-containing protein
VSADRSSAPDFEAILAALPEAVAVFDARGSIVYANERFAAVHGYRLDDLLGGGFARLTPDP